jgi:SIR2-like domain
MIKLINADIEQRTPEFRREVMSLVVDWRARLAQEEADLERIRREMGFEGDTDEMAPEKPATIATHDLYFEGDSLLSRRELVEASGSNAPSLSVGWDYLEKPSGYFAVGGGVVYVRDTAGYFRLPASGEPPIRATPAALGESRYRVREDRAPGGTMIILILPAGFTLVEPSPLPTEAKAFHDRIALFWRSNGEGGAMEVTLQLHPLQRDLRSEIEAINAKTFTGRPSATNTKGKVIIERSAPMASASTNEYGPLNDLRKAIADRKVIAIIGTGVATRSSGQALASWKGLLANGIDWCVSYKRPNATEVWAGRQREALISDDLDDLLGVAQQVSRKLGAPRDGAYRAWLQRTVGTLKVQQPDVLDALKALDIPIATTNYDGLIEEVVDWPPVTWQERSRVEEVLRGGRPGVLHLHGYWDKPESVVLDIRSYEQVISDAHAQAVLRSLLLNFSLLFIGFGSGLSDPNFGSLLE